MKTWANPRYTGAGDGGGVRASGDADVEQSVRHASGADRGEVRPSGVGGRAADAEGVRDERVSAGYREGDGAAVRGRGAAADAGAGAGRGIRCAAAAAVGGSVVTVSVGASG